MVTGRSAEAALQPVFDAIDQLVPEARKAGATAIGVSTPGWVDSRQGLILSAANLPCWRTFRLAEALESRYQLPAQLANDAKVAALAEAVWGSGSSYRNVFYVSLGTGIGTGMVLDRRLYYGHTGMAGEGGHMTIDASGPLCPCGKRGCIEMYASGLAIARRARERLDGASGPTSALFELVNGNLSAITAQAVGKAAMAGDAVAVQVLQEAAERLSQWLGNIIDLLEPEVIVIGGGLGQLMREFVGFIRERLDVWSINPRHRQIPIRSALYGSESGIVGSAALCLLPRRHWATSSNQGMNNGE
jgi:glucokinase